MSSANIPVGDNNELISIVMDMDYDLEVSADIMAALLMDDSVSTWEVYEDLSCRWVDGSDEFRRGMDCAIGMLTGYYLNDIAGKVLAEILEDDI